MSAFVNDTQMLTDISPMQVEGLEIITDVIYHQFI